ncbi:biliverdin-producing heme oxygenase [Rhodobacteraceae bacterium]|nr:biliverdin-producing heme oxygenase [Paracoccaceae bacterium]
MTTRSETARDALRLQTNDVHQQLHRHAPFVALFDGFIGRDDYCALMVRFYGFYAALDRAIAQALSYPTQGFACIERAGFLAQDLTDLGLGSAAIANCPACEDVNAIVTPASLGGVLYVIEGANLGATQIDRAAQKLLSPDHTRGRSFWAWSRLHNCSRWGGVTAYLADLDAASHPHKPPIHGANDVFQALANWLAPLDQSAVAMEVL